MSVLDGKTEEQIIRIVEQAEGVVVIYTRFGGGIDSPLWSWLNGLCDATQAAGQDISDLVQEQT